MPRKDVFYINEDFVKDVIEVRSNLGNFCNKPVVIPKGIAKTVKPNEDLTMDEWFKHVYDSLRQRDLFGNLI